MSSKSLLELLEKAGVVIGRAEQIISAQQATSEVARALHVEINTALLVSERIVYDQSDRPVEWIEVQYRPDIYQYGVDLQRTQSSEGNTWATAQSNQSLPIKKPISASRNKSRSKKS
jgi:GntR family transcriptional regulator